MKKILSIWLIITIVLVNVVTSVSFAADIESYIGKWSCEVKEFTPVDFNDLRSQIENIMGEKIPSDQWIQMQLTLQSAMNSNIKDVKDEKFTLDIYDDYDKGVNVDLINSNGSISNSIGATEQSGGLLFNMNRFINEYVKADTTMFIKIGASNSITGQTVIVQTISANGLNLKIKSVIDFTGVKTESDLIEEEEIIYIDRIEIVNSTGNIVNSTDVTLGSKIKFEYMIYPSDYTKDEVKKIEWYSNNSEILNVDLGGIVTVFHVGETQLGIWINDDYALSDIITINVIEKEDDKEIEDDKESIESEESGGSNVTDETPKSKTTDENENDGKNDNNQIDNKSDGNENDNTKEIVDKVEDVVTGFADIISKSTDFLPSPETMSKVPLLDILVFGYECDKDADENIKLGDSKDYAEKKSFWGNVLGLGPIGMVPKAADLVLELSKKIGFDFDFSFEQTVKGANNFAFDMFSGDSRANIDEMKDRHKKNHYGVVGGFGVWVSSTINDFSNRGTKLKNEMDNN